MTTARSALHQWLQAEDDVLLYTPEGAEEPEPDAQVPLPLHNAFRMGLISADTYRHACEELGH